MKYVTGIYALNLPSPDGTPGDWHFSSLNWERPLIEDSEKSPFGEWGLHVAEVPRLGRAVVANHVRACLDMIGAGNFGTVQGMREYYIDDESYTPVIFAMVSRLRNTPQWKEIDDFMGREFRCQWLDFKERSGEQDV